MADSRAGLIAGVVVVEPLTSSHVDSVARLHLRSLSGLLRYLGFRAIKAFYKGAVRSECAVAFVDLEQGSLGGFVLGSTNPQQLKREILANSFLETLVGTCRMALRSALMKRSEEPPLSSQALRRTRSKDLRDRSQERLRNTST